MEERWKNMIGYESKYMISNHGKVRSLPRKTRSNSVKDKILKDVNNGKGYRYVTLKLTPEIRKNHYIHRLVAAHFVENPLNKPNVNHIDNDKSNNMANNLEWVTQKENIIHCIKQGRSRYNWFPVLQFSMNDVLIKEHKSASHASREIGCTEPLIQMAANKNNKLKTAKGFVWKYKKDLI